MKSKIGLNFMVSVGRSMENGENALAKLLQASQDFVSFFYNFCPKVIFLYFLPPLLSSFHIIFRNDPWYFELYF